MNHICIEDKESLSKIRGSKYVQSNISDSYKKVRKKLIEGKIVLFTGTPCQIDGLNTYLNKEYTNLITIDILCHGVPSPKVFKSYLNYLEEKKKSKINSVNFRYKKPGWYFYSMKIKFDNNKQYIRNNRCDIYHRGFLRDYFLRPACHKCKYTNIDRVGDITLADFWGYTSECEADINDDKGISLCIVNSKKGEKIFNQVKDKLIVFERNLEEAIAANAAFSKNTKENSRRDEFWRDYNKSFKITIKKYLFPDKIGIKESFFVYTTYETRKKIKKFFRLKR